MKQLQYTVQVITNGTVDTHALQDSIASLPLNIHSVTVTSFKIVKGSK